MTTLLIPPYYGWKYIAIHPYNINENGCWKLVNQILCWIRRRTKFVQLICRANGLCSESPIHNKYFKNKKSNTIIIIINKDYNNNGNHNGKLILTCAVQLINTHLLEGNILRIDSYHLGYPKWQEWQWIQIS
jgi:hypothetical protein